MSSGSSSGQIKINHVSMDTCTAKLRSSASDFTDSEERIRFASETLDESWSGIAAVSFSQLMTGSLNLMVGCNEELKNIADLLDTTNRVFGDTDTNQANNLLGGDEQWLPLR